MLIISSDGRITEGRGPSVIGMQVSAVVLLPEDIMNPDLLDYIRYVLTMRMPPDAGIAEQMKSLLSALHTFRRESASLGGG